MDKKTPPAPARAQAGFTLVEIMVVIVILGLLMTLVLPNLIGAGDEARAQTAATQCKSIANAVRLYRASLGKLPTLDELTSEEAKSKTWYLENLDKDPWGNAYELREGNSKDDWEVVSNGPDGQSGNDDDISSKTKKDQ
ncbi:MAG: type II secretion system major pseudopilin GspG [Planctomycetes bacterium]|nr:type II secretion system major pseudopilin GspG [Planctomycetota bacterium]